MKHLLLTFLMFPFIVNAQKISVAASGGYEFMGNPGFVDKYGESSLNSYYASASLILSLPYQLEIGECVSIRKMSTEVLAVSANLPGQTKPFKNNYFTAHYANPLLCFSFFLNKHFLIHHFNPKPIQKFYTGLHIGLLLSENALAKTDNDELKLFNDGKGFNAGIQLGYLVELSNTVSFTLEATPGYYLIKYTGNALNNKDYKSGVVNIPISAGVKVNL